MADVSFYHVPAEGFTAFATQLDQGEWRNIDVSAYIGADGRLLKSIGDAPGFVMLKAQLVLVVKEVSAIVDSTGGAKGFDDSWDNTQKRFSGLIALARLSAKAQERDAAERLHAKLLLGRSGEGQTRLSYQQEVDFGRNQIRLADETQTAADIALLGLGSVMAQIATATEDLAGAINVGRQGQAPAKQRKAAVADCVHAFGTVYRSLDWLERSGDPADQTKAGALRSTLDALTSRYPGRETKTKAAPAVAPPVV